MAIGAAAALLLSACSGGGSEREPSGPDTSNLPEGVVVRDDGAWMLERNEPVEGGTLTVALEAAVEFVDPARTEGSGGGALLRAVFDELFHYDSDGEVVPHLAESLETADNGKTWELKLREGVTFTDGSPLDAAAVIAHWQRIGEEGSTSRSAAEVRRIERLEATDSTTVTVVLAQRSLNFPKVIMATPGHMNFIGSPAAAAQWGSEVGFHPVGAGPFSVESFTSNGDAILKKNPDYWRDGLPYLDTLHFVTAVDTQSRLSAALAGDLDLAMSQIGVDLQAATDGGLVSLYQPSTTYFNVIFNLSKPPFDDARFREAVIRGTDLDGLNQAVFGGQHAVMTGILQEDNPFYVDTDWPSFDPERAKELVEEWQADTGLEPRFAYSVSSPPINQATAAVIQQMMADIGITMSLAVADQPTLISEARSGNYEAQMRFVGMTAEVDQALFANFHSASSANNSHGSDPEVDRLLVEARDAGSVADRAEIYEEIQERFREWLPMMPMIQHRNGWYAGDRVGGFPGTLPGTALIDVAMLYVSE